MRSSRLIWLLASICLLLLLQSVANCDASHHKHHKRARRRRLKEEEERPGQAYAEALIAGQLKGDAANYTVPLYNRLRGLRYLGDGIRLRLLLERMQRGEAIVGHALGGSITAGQGCGGGRIAWPYLLSAKLNQLWPAKSGQHAINNHGIPGITSSYIAPCLEMYLPQQTDLVIVDFGVNDTPAPDKHFDTAQRTTLERLLRRILTWPSQPVVILIDFFIWLAGPRPGSYWSNAERDFLELATYYSIPLVSWKAAMHPLIITNTTGYTPEEVFGNPITLHPGPVGHISMIELITTLMETSLAVPLPPSSVLKELAAEPLQVPMVPSNYEAKHSLCFLQDRLKRVVQDAGTWNWTDEGRGRAKAGYVTTKPGDTITLQVTAVATAGSSGDGVVLQVAYLQSYTSMGFVKYQCTSGCSCKPGFIDSHVEESKVSVTVVKSILVSPSPKCIVTLINQARSSRAKGGTKFKLMGIMVSEVATSAVPEKSGISWLRATSANIYENMSAKDRAKARAAKRMKAEAAAVTSAEGAIESAPDAVGDGQEDGAAGGKSVGASVLGLARMRSRPSAKGARPAASIRTSAVRSRAKIKG